MEIIITVIVVVIIMLVIGAKGKTPYKKDVALQRATLTIVTEVARQQAGLGRPSTTSISDACSDIVAACGQSQRLLGCCDCVVISNKARFVRAFVVLTGMLPDTAVGNDCRKHLQDLIQVLEKEEVGNED